MGKDFEELPFISPQFPSVSLRPDLDGDNSRVPQTNERGVLPLEVERFIREYTPVQIIGDTKELAAQNIVECNRTILRSMNVQTYAHIELMYLRYRKTDEGFKLFVDMDAEVFTRDENGLSKWFSILLKEMTLEKAYATIFRLPDGIIIDGSRLEQVVGALNLKFPNQRIHHYTELMRELQ